MSSSPRRLAVVVPACLVLAGLAPAHVAHAQAAGTGDSYAGLVARAEAGDPSTDFRALRFAWLDSAEHRSAPPAGAEKAMRDAAAAADNAKVRDAAEQVISARYVDLEAHMMRRLACVALQESECAEHEHFVEFGLLKSILDSGDGKTAASAWHVASIDEEYFVMHIAQVTLKQQALIQQNGRTYDQLTVTDAKGADKAMWFDITDFFGKALG
ncbi:MAG TPA: DUF4919 domain-containing protein [Caulobacteraceae bacterium]|jgi:hypothetical protein|nr:DUF4919 domain-containing protein [Caulobacteraceae bacterium]